MDDDLGGIVVYGILAVIWLAVLITNFIRVTP